MKSLNSRRNVLKAGTLLGIASLLPETGNATPSALLTAKSQKIIYPADMKAKLVGHENHWGASKKSVKAVSETLFQTNYYPTFPDNLIKQLTEKIAREEKIAPEQVLLGCGSTENLMSAAFRYGPGGQLITSELTWGPDRAFVNSIQEHGGEWLKIPVKEDLSQDLEALAAAINPKATVMYVVNPNFWTAHHIAVPQMKEFINTVSGKVPLIVDEAYIEYSGQYDDISMVSAVREGKMLVVSRTFSKVYGLPGLRLGYMMGHPEMIKEIKKFSMNGKGLSKPALAAGIASYRDTVQLAEIVKKTAEVKNYLYTFFEKNNVAYLKSGTNFMSFKSIGGNKEKFQKEMKNAGVSVYGGFTVKGNDYTMITIATMEEVKFFTTVLENKYFNKA